MTITADGATVEVAEAGGRVPLTRERLAADVLAAAGGKTALKGPGVPTGGAAGKVLAKRSAADHDMAWVDPPVLAAAPIGCVRHGSTGSTPRPGGFAIVLWIGLVQPNLAQAGDLWVVA
jgi:hypothetical protein